MLSRSFYSTSVTLGFVVAVITFLPSYSAAGVIFHDDLASFNTGEWNTNATVFSKLGAATYIGSPQVLQSEIVDGESVLRMRSTLFNAQRRGIATFKTFNLSEGRVEVDFKIMPRVGVFPYNNIDAILELSFLNADTGTNFNIRVFGGNFGETVNVQAAGNLDSIPYTSATGVWIYNESYRFVVEDIGDKTRASFRSALNQEIVVHDFNFDLADMGNVSIGLSQSMGAPQITRFADVAVNEISIFAVPEPSTSFQWLLLIGTGAISVSRRVPSSIRSTK